MLQIHPHSVRSVICIETLLEILWPTREILIVTMIPDRPGSWKKMSAEVENSFLLACDHDSYIHLFLFLSSLSKFSVTEGHPEQLLSSSLFLLPTLWKLWIEGGLKRGDLLSQSKEIKTELKREWERVPNLLGSSTTPTRLHTTYNWRWEHARAHRERGA